MINVFFPLVGSYVFPFFTVWEYLVMISDIICVINVIHIVRICCFAGFGLMGLLLDTALVAGLGS